MREFGVRFLTEMQGFAWWLISSALVLVVVIAVAAVLTGGFHGGDTGPVQCGYGAGWEC